MWGRPWRPAPPPKGPSAQPWCYCTAPLLRPKSKSNNSALSRKPVYVCYSLPECCVHASIKSSIRALAQSQIWARTNFCYGAFQESCSRCGEGKSEIVHQGLFFWALASPVTVEMCNRDSKRKLPGTTLQRPGFGWDFSQRYPLHAPAAPPWLQIFFQPKACCQSMSHLKITFLLLCLSSPCSGQVNMDQDAVSSPPETARLDLAKLDEGSEAWSGPRGCPLTTRPNPHDFRVT